LGSDHFEQLLIVKSKWCARCGTISDWAVWAVTNSEDIEEVDLVEYEEFLDADEQGGIWDAKDEGHVFESEIEQINYHTIC
jgi:hypothetical protein